MPSLQSVAPCLMTIWAVAAAVSCAQWRVPARIGLADDPAPQVTATPPGPANLPPPAPQHQDRQARPSSSYFEDNEMAVHKSQITPIETAARRYGQWAYSDPDTVLKDVAAHLAALALAVNPDTLIQLAQGRVVPFLLEAARKSVTDAPALADSMKAVFSAIWRKEGQVTQGKADMAAQALACHEMAAITQKALMMAGEKDREAVERYLASLGGPVCRGTQVGINMPKAHHLLWQHGPTAPLCGGGQKCSRDLMPARYPLRVVGAEGRDEVSFVLDVGKKPFEIIVTPPSGTAKIGWGLEIGGIGVVAATATVCGILYSPGAAWYAGLGTGLGIGVAAMAAGIYLITTSPKGDIKLVPIPLPPGTEQKK